MSCDQNIIMVIENITHMGTYYCYLFPIIINYLSLIRNEWQILKWEFKYKYILRNKKLEKIQNNVPFQSI